jgi:Flp pilus assembly protein TadD
VLAKATPDAKIRSALLTTRGGALRDLSKLNEAKSMGLEAHELTPKDFRPCTLLGAVHIELGDLMAGHAWYMKAEKLGADKRSVDNDLRTLLARASQSEQQRISEFLLQQDPQRFAWLRKK